MRRKAQTGDILVIPFVVISTLFISAIFAFLATSYSIKSPELSKIPNSQVSELLTQEIQIRNETHLLIDAIILERNRNITSEEFALALQAKMLDNTCLIIGILPDLTLYSFKKTNGQISTLQEIEKYESYYSLTTLPLPLNGEMIEHRITYYQGECL